MNAQRLAFHRAGIEQHRLWLAPDQRRLKRFDDLLASQPESAFCEALVGAQLRSWVNRVECYEDLSSGGPDYVCTQRGRAFYVESRCLTCAAVSKATWMRDTPRMTEGHAVGSLARLIFTAVNNKLHQCTRDDAPTVIAVGTLHLNATEECVDESAARDMLISHEFYTVPIPCGFPEKREPGYFATDLRRSVFMEVTEDGVQAKRQPVSAVVLFGFARHPAKIVGILNGNTLRPFDPSLLPGVPFAQAEVIDNRVGLRWHNKGNGDDAH